jgi:phosphatidylglycerol:prolipoprotein diacylglycerol transferase
MFASPGPIAIQIGPLALRWYGIFTATAILVALWLVDRQARAEGLPADEIANCIGWSIAAGYVGARLYEVAFNWDYYGRNWAKIPAVWEGGLAIHGGLIVGCATGIALVARRGLPVLRTMDLAGPSFAIAQAIGRWGNFFNEEAFGEPTDLPWKLYISPAHRPLEYRSVEFFHPTFLYESLWDLAVFVALVWWLRPRWHARPGALFFWYIGLYSVGRFTIESVRLDSFWAGGYRVPQLASLAGIMVSVCGLVWVSRRARGRATQGGSR